MIRHLLRFASVAIFSVFLVACGSKLTQENFNKISNGMPYTDVVNILGEPKSSEGGGVLGITTGSSVWEDGKHQVSITFINEKVAGKSFTEIKPQSAENK